VVSPPKVKVGRITRRGKVGLGRSKKRTVCRKVVVVVSSNLGLGRCRRLTNISTRPAPAAIFNRILLAMLGLGVANFAHSQAG
jgi:hypothetical protein